MALKITEECINCGACEPECPNNAIYEGSFQWRFSDGTNLKGVITLKSGVTTEACQPQAPKKNEIYFIVADKCTECVGFYDEPRCASVCPVDCCVLDEESIESKDELLEKKKFLHS